MIILNKKDILKALPMAEAIEAMKRAYAALSGGKAEVPLRTSLSISPHQGISLFMPAFVQNEAGDSLAIKVVSLYPKNIERGLALIQAAVLVLEADTGQPLALLDGSSLTAIRTGAASGAATDLLARKNSRVAAIFGAGVQGRTQLEAICNVREIETVWIYDPDSERAAMLMAEMAGKAPVPTDLRGAKTPAQAIAQADIICTATTSSTPVFQDRYLKPGVHINGVGSYTHEMQEIPPETVQRAYVVIDSRTAALSEAGDLLKPLNLGLISKTQLQIEIGQIVLGHRSGRSDDEQITFFKSVGLAVQDAVAAQLALDNARSHGLGQVVEW